MEDIGSKVRFLAKKGFFGYKNPPGGSKNFFDTIFFYWSSKWHGHLTSCKKSEKISNGLGCRTGTHVRTYGRTHKSEFIGSLSDKSREPKIKSMHSNAF